MGLIDGILGQVGNNLAVEAIAKQVGLPPELAEKAIAALGKAQPEPGDTVTCAAQSSGIDANVLAKVVEQLGGEGALGQISGLIKDNPQIANSVIGMLDRDGDGNPLDDLAGLAGSLLGKK